MSLTLDEATSAINQFVRDAWQADPITATVPLYFDQTPFDKPGAPVPPELVANPWALCTQQIAESTQFAMGCSESNTTGQVSVAIYGSPGSGGVFVTQAAGVLLRAYRTVLPTGGVDFNNARLERVGNVGAWYLGNALANFRFTEKVQ